MSHSRKSTLLVHLVLLASFCFTIKASPLELNGIDVNTSKPTTIAWPLQKKAYILSFLSPQCPCSLSHEPVLKELARKYPEFEFVGVVSNPQQKESELKEHFDKANLGFKVLKDIDLELANTFKALRTPHVFVFNNKAELIYSGGIDNSRNPLKADKHFLVEVLRAVKMNQKSPYSKTRALGCYIR